MDIYRRKISQVKLINWKTIKKKIRHLILFIYFFFCFFLQLNRMILNIAERFSYTTFNKNQWYESGHQVGTPLCHVIKTLKSLYSCWISFPDPRVRFYGLVGVSAITCVKCARHCDHAHRCIYIYKYTHAYALECIIHECSDVSKYINVWTSLLNSYIHETHTARWY